MSMEFTKPYTFLQNHKKSATIVISITLAVLFAASVLLCIFLGDEFKLSEAENKVMGLMRFNKGVYSTYYFVGEQFSYDTENSSILCIVKDPEKDGEIVKDEDLHPKYYGFRINGEGKVYDKPSEVIMNSDVKFVSVTHKKYTSLHIDVPVKVYSSFDESRLTDVFTYEAEDADLYKDEVLLSAEDKKSLPDVVEPFISSVGTVKGENCSGGACLRSFKSNEMRVVFEFFCKESTQAELTVVICKRPNESKKLSAYYDFTLNGEEVEDISGASIEQASSKNYFESFEIKATVNLKRGINSIIFQSGSSIGKKNPANLDAIRLSAPSAVLGSMDLLVV